MQVKTPWDGYRKYILYPRILQTPSLANSCFFTDSPLPFPLPTMLVKQTVITS